VRVAPVQVDERWGLMAHLNPSEIIGFLTAVGILLVVARTLGEFAKKLNQPAVLGELIAGILLGPTIFGAFFPKLSAVIIPLEGHSAIALDGFMNLGIVLFLLVAGMEVELSTVWRQGKASLNVSVLGIVVPFAVGFIASWWLPHLVGYEMGQNKFIYSLFVATALSISALPVIARTLMDLNLYRSDMGMLIIAAAVMDDAVGWILFAIILAMMGGPHIQGSGINGTIWMTLAFAGFMLTLGRWLANRILPWLQAHTTWPGGVLAFSLAFALFCAAFTEWIGVHAIFGSFFAGVVLGDSIHMREETRSTINRFVAFMFAPIFFAGIGLRVNFIANFDLPLVLFVLVIATIGKLLGAGAAARFSGMNRRESLAVGFGMNARGTMEIILGLLALQFGVIKERMFVALVVMAIVTSMMSGPMMEYLLKLKKKRRLTDFLVARAVLPHLKAQDRQRAIAELISALAPNSGKAQLWMEAVWDREQILATGIGRGLAVPHARIDGLASAMLGVGLTKTGIDFDAPDGYPAQLIFLILTPLNDDGLQLEILADIAQTFGDKDLREKAMHVTGYTEFLALVKSERKE
jgi:Kef-type K+ transport system membrane component KefB/mannitol/fructose-specific phosphotransferase system IIA component (Ntr-type)